MPRIGGSPQPAFQTISIEAQDAIKLAEAIARLRSLFLRNGDAHAAQRVSAIYFEWVREVQRISDTVALRSERYILDRISATQRRPDTGRGRSLKDNIKSEAWEPNPRTPFGWVGMALIAELDKTVNHQGDDARPYWRAQEFGHRYSHTPRGFFFGPGYGGGQSRPSPSAAGVHPLFLPMRGGGKFRAPPRINARHFLRDGSMSAVRDWQREMATARASAAAKLNALGRQLSSGGPGGGRRRRRR